MTGSSLVYRHLVMIGCCYASLTQATESLAQARYDVRIPILIEFVGPREPAGEVLKGKRPSWRLRADPSALVELGLIREADKVKVEVNPPLKKLTIGSWSEKWERYAGKRCSGFGPWKTCTKKYVHEKCEITYEQKPLDPPATLRIDILSEEINALRKTFMMNSGSPYINYTADGPRSIVFGGLFDREPIRCDSPPGQKSVGPITKQEVKGDGKPEYWFAVTVSVEQPLLDD